MSSYSKERALDHIVDLSGRGNDLVTFWREVGEVVEQAVPLHGGPCWYTLDPASLLITSHFNQYVHEFPDDWLRKEYYEDDVNQLVDVVRSERGIQTLHEVTNGDPSTSPRWHHNMEMGGDQELIAALRTPSGEVWGALGIYRNPGMPMFEADDLRFISAASTHLAEGARRGLLVGEATDPELPDAPGLVVVSADLEVESTTPGVERWLTQLPDGDWNAGRLPSAVASVALRALRTAEDLETPGELAVARVLAQSGTWVVLHGASLVSDGSRRAAVIVEPAHPARISPLLMAAYGLTEREQDVTRLVLQANSTAEIASALVVSPHTVQQHLKSIFEKTGVRSRRDLVGKVFFAHYQPRFRDNEARVPLERPLRGGPAPLEPA